MKAKGKSEDVGDEDAISSLAGLGLPEPHASARTSWTPAGPDAAGSAAAAANPERGGASQGGMGPRRSIGKRALAVRPTVSNAVGNASGRRKRAPVVQRGSSAFVGVHWNMRSGRWQAGIQQHDGSKHHLGCFDDEQEAARAFDDAARRLRSKGMAHGARSGTNWQRLNFPTAAETAFAKREGMPTVGSAAEKFAVTCKQLYILNIVQRGQTHTTPSLYAECAPFSTAVSKISTSAPATTSILSETSRNYS